MCCCECAADRISSQLGDPLPLGAWLTPEFIGQADTEEGSGYGSAHTAGVSAWLEGAQVAVPALPTAVRLLREGAEVPPADARS